MTRHFFWTIRWMVALVALALIGLPLATARAADDGTTAQPVLLHLEKQDGQLRSLLILGLTGLPPYKVLHSGERVDIVLPRTEVTENLSLPRPDGQLVDVKIIRRPGDVLLSFFLRRPALAVSALTQERPARIIVTVTWPVDPPRRLAIAHALPGRPTAEGVVVRRKPSSPYQGRWLQFFEEYQTPFLLQLPVRPALASLSPPPGITDLPDGLRLQDAVTVGNWGLVLSVLAQGEAPTEPAQATVHARLLAEALLRLNKIAEALARLQPLAEGAPEDPRVGYLTAVALARQGRIYDSLLQLAAIEPQLGTQPELFAPVTLLRAELALAQERPEKALEHLTDPILVQDSRLNEWRELRLLDARVLKNGLDGAADAYRPWRDRPLLYRHPLSLGLAASAMMRAQDWATAKELLRALNTVVTQPAAHSLLQYAEILTDDRLQPGAETLQRLMSLAVKEPVDEGVRRARMRQLDLQVLSGEGRETPALHASYQAIAEGSLRRELRQEAAFKRALLYYLNGRLPEAIDALSSFRRANLGSLLMTEVDALLVEALPPYLKALMATGRDLDALVLVERHRELLLQGGIDNAFLEQLAESMNRLGLWEKAARVYLFLLEAAGGQPEVRSNFYYPLIRMYYAAGDYDMAIRYSAQYFDEFSSHADRFRIFELWVRGCLAQGDMDRVKYLLGKPDRPSNSRIEALACDVYWELQDYEEVQRLAIRIGENLPAPQLARVHYLQAEALYQLGRYRQALDLYRGLQTEATYQAPALYRAARIHLHWQQKAEAAALLDRLLAQGPDTRWAALARDLLFETR